ncbi:hypothetical protein PHYSODRAFT_493070 [Phytophthora sojae]|uniref:Uncharacterized protein n=1 Tax=Phytophthora sojae (strain P6497) TaxID=1094619 RepID=G4Z3K9_PHYSP|nr:hypothetical protein PHYSODRAFT_493070 [Phytophthora sojae]EGZ19381.1 hypothetical protein PHYSODRAFT_493070 [Phytophthora sojae]|eukprot:XP_009522098.1 hypothetical protein PHYSODRAFT_493070 [Phytophthora sojae]
MQKASFLAALVLAIAGSAIFAAGQDTTKATLFIGSSQNSAESVVCLNGHSTCRALSALEEEEAESIVLKPLNETSGDKEIVCFGKYCCTRCYQYRNRRLEEVVDEHRRLEVTGESHVQDIACVSEPWGLQCN